MTRLGNLIFAVGLCFAAYGNWNNLQVERSAATVINLIVAPFWLFGAVGMYWKDRLTWCSCLRMAWCASTLGTGTMLANSIVLIGISLTLVPIATDPTDGIGYMLIIGSLGFSLATCILIGLFRLRWTLVRGTT